MSPNRSDDEIQDVALGDLRRCLGSIRAVRRVRRPGATGRGAFGREDRRPGLHDRAALRFTGQRSCRHLGLLRRGEHAGPGEIAEQPPENAAGSPSLNTHGDRLGRIECPQSRVQTGEREVDLADLEEKNVAQRFLLNRQPLPRVSLADRESEGLPRHARRAGGVLVRRDDCALSDNPLPYGPEAVDDHSRRHGSGDLAGTGRGGCRARVRGADDRCERRKTAQQNDGHGRKDSP